MLGGRPRQQTSGSETSRLRPHPRLSSLQFQRTIRGMKLLFALLKFSACLAIIPTLVSCGGGSAFSAGPPNMGGPSVEVRKAQIAQEETGDFFYGRRYYVHKTRFWGYLREPRKPWSTAKLVIFNESRGKQPDRLSETAPPDERYGYDNNFEYRIKGFYTGDTVYEINSNQILPEFMLTGYELLDRDPGWLFSPNDHYATDRITLRPGS